MDNRLLSKTSKYLIITSFVLVFLGTLIVNTPAWVLNIPLTKYTQGKLRLYNLTGSFWNGSGLLVALNKKSQQTDGSPLISLKWQVSLGVSKYINVKLNLGTRDIANIYLNNKGLNVDNLDLSLSVIQVSQLSDVITDLKLSGNLQINTKHLLIAKTQKTGIIYINAHDISSGVSPVNPLGSYKVALDIGTNLINVNTISDDTILSLNGNGSTSALTLKAAIDPSKTEQMKTFITLMGVPNADGTFNLKLF
ncbi:MAG: hypothetical protein K0R49_125 [Burkholderiales bacterium]|jgi:hypothetical protein|nr:hypothetical protein [Burkholderiales bacterium]MCE3267873.1 hypothetical protein [Burkholderiales bacterium]